VDSQPQGATVHYDYKPVGKTPVDIPVRWYGKHKLTLDHPEHGRRVQIVDLDSPLYLTFPLDFIATVAPARIKDNHSIMIDFTKDEASMLEDDNGAKGTENTTE
jgi:hypothetical protein